MASCGGKKQEKQMQAQQDSMAEETSKTADDLINNIESEMSQDSASADTSSTK